MSLLASVESMKVVELRAELTKRGLNSTGVKAELVKRLSDALGKDEEDEVDILGEAPAPVPAKPAVEPPKQPAVAVPAKTAAGPTKSTAAAPVKTAAPTAAAPAKTSAPTTVAKSAPPKQTPTDDEAAKRASRASRFGVETKVEVVLPLPNELISEERKKMRAQKLGLKRERPSSDLVDAEKLEARAKKFGIAPPAKVLVAPEKLQKRAKKFSKSSIGGQTTVQGDDWKSKKQQRAQRFGQTATTDAEKAKAEQRKARFSKQ